MKRNRNERPIFEKHRIAGLIPGLSQTAFIVQEIA
jgi:hypothetical protein